MAQAWRRWAAAGVLCAAAAGWIAWSSAPVPPAAAARPAAGRGRAARPGTELADAAAGERERASERGLLPVETAPAALPPADLGAPGGPALAPPLADGVPLRVVRGRTDEPVPYALVSFGELLPPDRLAREARDAPREEVVGALQHYRADAAGRLKVPRSERTSCAFASAEGAWGWIDLEPHRTAEERVLRVFPDRAVAVRVVAGPERAPVAGAEVGLRYETSPGDSTLLDAKRTGEDGVARFEHLRQYVEYYWAHTEKLAVVLCGVFADPPEAALDPEGVPEVVELVLPACTALEVRVVGAGGAPVRAPALVRVARASENAYEAFDDLGRTAAGVARDGVIVFDQIGPSLDLLVSAHTDEAAAAAARPARSAPEAGGRAVALIELDRARPVLTGRVLLPDGAPAAGRALSVALLSEDGRLQTEGALATDGEGRFRRVLSHAFATQARLRLELRAEEGGGSLSAAAPAEGPFEAGEHALGDLRLAADPLLVAGRVVTDAGKPVADAAIHVTRTLPFGGQRSAARARTGPDGAFEARGAAQGPLWVFVEHPACAGPMGVRADPGAEDLEIVVQDAGGIAGSVLFDEEWLCDFAYARARRDGTEAWTHEARIDRPGFFELLRLPPGGWTVELCMDAEEEGGVRVEGVRVAAGETARDPRLLDVDLRGKARYVSLRVVAEDGAPIEEGTVYHRRPGGGAWTESARVEHGAAHVFTQLPELELYVAAEERRSAFVPGARDGQEVVLAEGIPVRFRWSGAPPPNDRTLSATYTFETALPDLPVLAQDAPISDGAEVFDPVPFPEAGRYDVVWSLMRWTGTAWNAVDSAREPLVILERSGVEEYEIALPAPFRAEIEAAPRR